jgi:hypothetical protein
MGLIYNNQWLLGDNIVNSNCKQYIETIAFNTMLLFLRYFLAKYIKHGVIKAKKAITDKNQDT